MADRDGAYRLVEHDTGLRAVWQEFEDRWIVVPLAVFVIVALFYLVSCLPGMAAS